LIGGLLLAVIVALAAAAYGEVRRTSMRIASERLVSVTTQFRDLFQQSGVQLRARAAAAANKPALIQFASARGARTRDRALAELKYAGPQPEQVVATELRDSSGGVLLSTAAAGSGPDAFVVREIGARPQPRDSAVIGAFHLLRDTIVYPIVASVASPGAHTYLVQWRRLTGSRRAREQITHLIGSDATLFLGNADGSQWTDLERPVAAPLPKRDTSRAIQLYTRANGKRYLMSAASIPRTPWVVAVDFPFSGIMAPVDSFSQRIALIALVALGLALLAATAASRRITEPLSQLTVAADAIAQGDYSKTVRIERSDELGRLGHAFATMATEVQHAREGLEKKVEERTRDLNDTLQQLHNAQESLVRREKLAMLGQLASGVGHELRNPLGVMTNAVYYLRMVLASSPNATIVEYLDILQQQITLSEKIVGDLLDFARSKPPQRKPTSVAEVTRLQIDRLGAHNGVRIETDFPADLPPVLVDHVQMGQIILNLLTNAIQALDGRGSVVVNAHANGAAVHVDVVDTGPGVPPENIEKIFEPLFTTKARGIGLGLAVSRTLARANGGDLVVRDMMGQGATFRLTLPKAPENGA
jgi:signal transduction histidine kinase